MDSEGVVDSYELKNTFNRLSVAGSDNKDHTASNGVINNEESTLKWGFSLNELYRLALRFYKEKEGKAFHFSYQDKLKLVALTQQICHGKYNPDSLPPLGVLDVIGRDRRLAWQALGDASKAEAMDQFVNLLDQQCSLFKPTIDAHRADVEERERLKKEEELRKKKEDERRRLEKEMRIKEEEEMLKQESQKRQIQEALNQQTYVQFKSYAEQQYPGNPEQQAVLVRQLQDQHYHLYMQQLMQQQQLCSSTINSNINNNNTSEKSDSVDSREGTPPPPLIIPNGIIPHEETADSDEEGGSQSISLASMWTRKDIKQFKESIRKEGGDAIIKVGHGETVTVRVPTHEDGTCLFWEFATDNYGIGFGVYFEWTKSPTNQVSVHVSESEDDDDIEDDDDEDEEEVFTDDIERANTSVSKRLEAAANRPPLSIIVPVYRRDCYDEVYAGSHQYPGQGVYLLKFDNSYSLWRSKTLYYRVYYTRD